ncbi:MAG: DUF6722 family protein [Parabacteroides sp.]
MKKESKEAILFEIGKFLIDIAKLVFGGVILAGIMKYENINQWLLFGLGGSVVLACFSAGAILTALFKKRRYNNGIDCIFMCCRPVSSRYWHLGCYPAPQ